jgi:hypothetical protein
MMGLKKNDKLTVFKKFTVPHPPLQGWILYGIFWFFFFVISAGYDRLKVQRLEEAFGKYQIS